MNIHMTFKKMDATEALKTHVNDRTERLKKFVGSQTEFLWVFYLEADDHVADLRVQGPHIDVFAQAKSNDMYLSIDEVSEKIERQLRKNKEIVKDHLHRSRASG
jgi:putative sigma-54 modulation protein